MLLLAVAPGCEPAPPSNRFVRIATQTKFTELSNTTASIELLQRARSIRHVVVAFNRFATLLQDGNTYLAGGSAMGVGVSENAGDSWRVETIAHDRSGAGATVFGSPALAAAPAPSDGSWPAAHYVAVGGAVDPGGAAARGTIVYARSDDGGVTFRRAMTMADPFMHVRTECTDPTPECRIRNCGRTVPPIGTPGEPYPTPLWTTVADPSIVASRDPTGFNRIDVVFVADPETTSAQIVHVYGFRSSVAGNVYGTSWCLAGRIPIDPGEQRFVRHPRIVDRGGATLVVVYQVREALAAPIGNADMELRLRLRAIVPSAPGPLVSHSYLGDGSPGRGRRFYVARQTLGVGGSNEALTGSLADLHVFPGQDRDIEIVWTGNETPQNMSATPWPAIHHQSVNSRVIRPAAGAPYLANDYSEVTTLPDPARIGPAFQPTLTGLPGGFGLRSINYVQQDAATGGVFLAGVSRLSPTGSWGSARNLTGSVRGGAPDMPLCSTGMNNWGAYISALTLFGFYPGEIRPIDPTTGQPLPPYIGPLPFVTNVTFHVDGRASVCSPFRTDLAAAPQEVSMTRWAP